MKRFLIPVSFLGILTSVASAQPDPSAPPPEPAPAPAPAPAPEVTAAAPPAPEVPEVREAREASEVPHEPGPEKIPVGKHGQGCDPAGHPRAGLVPPRSQRRGDARPRRSACAAPRSRSRARSCRSASAFQVMFDPAKVRESAEHHAHRLGRRHRGGQDPGGALVGAPGLLHHGAARQRRRLDRPVQDPGELGGLQLVVQAAVPRARDDRRTRSATSAISASVSPRRSRSGATRRACSTARARTTSTPTCRRTSRCGSRRTRSRA